MSGEHMQETIATLENIKPGSTIALTADFANENPNSICRIAMAWISGIDVYSVGFYVKPPTDDFSLSRKITAEMVAESDCFATVWDNKIKPLLKINILSAYQTEKLFTGIKASYEASGQPFTELNYFVRDLTMMASTYLDLGNYSLPSIAHKMNISVDLDSAVSRAMACVAAIDWLDSAYPSNNFGIPLGAILGGYAMPVGEAPPQPQRFTRSQKGLGFFVMLCLIAAIIFMNYYFIQVQKEQSQQQEQAQQQAQTTGIPEYDQNKTYSMARGTYVVTHDKDIESFMTAAQKKDSDSIRTMVRNDKVLVFGDRTTVKVTGSSIANGFIPVTITDGRFSGSTGYAPFNMIEDSGQ